MIIDAHAHYTSAPPQLQAYRGTQITNYARPAKGRLQVSDEQLEQSVGGQVGRMDEWGIDRLMFSPQATAMGHQFGTPLISRHWTEHCNDLIGRIAKLMPDRFSAVCQLPQSPGVPPTEWVDELDRCVNELGFVACNINPDISGGAQPFTPSVGDEWWYPLWEKMVQLDVPGTIHASATLNPAFHVTSSHYICQHHNAGVVGRIGHQHHVREKACQRLNFLSGCRRQPFTESADLVRGEPLVTEGGQDVGVPGEHPAVDPLIPVYRVLFPKLLITRVGVSYGGRVQRRGVVQSGTGLMGHQSFLQTPVIITRRRPVGCADRRINL